MTTHTTKQRNPLTVEDRAIIATLLKSNETITAIAETLGRHKSVISREIKRNSNKDGRY